MFVGLIWGAMTDPRSWQHPQYPQGQAGPYGSAPPPGQVPPPGAAGYPQGWPAPRPAPRAGNNELLIRLLVALPLTLIGGLVLLIVSIMPVAILEDRLSTDAENWLPIPVFTGLVTVATVVARAVARGWVPLDLPAWALMFLALPILDTLLTETWELEGLIYVVLMLLISLGTLVRLIAFHVFATRNRSRGAS